MLHARGAVGLTLEIPNKMRAPKHKDRLYAQAAFRSAKEKEMCDMAREKTLIDSILTEAMNHSSVRTSINEIELAGYGLAALRSEYALTCSDECMRKRCDEFAALIVLSRRAQQPALRLQ